MCLKFLNTKFLRDEITIVSNYLLVIFAKLESDLF